MFDLIMFLRRLALLPYEIISYPFRAANSNWNSSFRSRALMLGMPALLVAVLGICSIAFSQMGRNTRLVSYYKGLQSSAQRDYQKLANNINQERRLSGSVAEDDPRFDEIDELRKNERIFLEKLMDLDPENPEHKFNLAMTYGANEIQQQQALLETLAPEEEPVYYEAHNFMAKQYFARATDSRTSYAEKKLLLEKAEIHSDHCLVQNEDDRIVMQIKAKVLEESEQLQKAYAIYLQLFEKDPVFYVRLVELNQKLNMESRNNSVVNIAESNFKNILNSNTDDNTSTWVRCWNEITKCLLIKEEFQDAIRQLEGELANQRDPARKKFIQERIAHVYTQWSGSKEKFLASSTEERKVVLERLRQAYMRNPKFELALSKIAWFVNGAPNLSDDARMIYDPYLDKNAPAAVLSELGAHALSVRDFDRAVQFFDGARKKHPENPLILNNLAYSYLVSEGRRNPERALYLVDTGIRKLVNKKDIDEFRTYLEHTRGTALMQLGRMEEAAASFESALRGRPENEEIIESLVRCYEGRIDRQSQMYKQYLAEIRAKNRQTEESGG